jgi:hypothetical protein
MSEVEFEADVQDTRGINHYSSRSGSFGAGSVGASSQSDQAPGSTSNIGMVRWLVRHGIIRGDGGAKFILFGIVAINFIATGLILYFYVLH